MKQHITLLLLIISILPSCKKDKIEYKNDFEKSYSSWLNFKASSNDSYRYTVNTSSWAGYSSATIISVRKGNVLERSYKALAFNSQTRTTTVYEEWSEDGNSLNIHTNGAATLTLDEIYKKVETDWLKKRKDASVYFEAKNNGMISSCGYVPDGCQDDCFIGISISLIEKW